MSEPIPAAAAAEILALSALRRQSVPLTATEIAGWSGLTSGSGAAGAVSAQRQGRCLPKRERVLGARNGRNLMATWAERMQRQYAEGLANVANDLREMADRVERDGMPRRRSDGSLAAIGYPEGSEFSAAAHRVLHAITWGVANLNLEHLLRRAVEADAAPRLDAETNEGDA